MRVERERKAEKGKRGRIRGEMRRTGGERCRVSSENQSACVKGKNDNPSSNREAASPRNKGGWKVTEHRRKRYLSPFHLPRRRRLPESTLSLLLSPPYATGPFPAALAFSFFFFNLRFPDFSSLPVWRYNLWSECYCHRLFSINL